jgi:septum formation protein
VHLILASASPRRADLLRAAGIEIDIRPADVDESIHPGETPEGYASRVARSKAQAVSVRVPDRVVLAADTIVVVDATILGKPANADDAGRMLRMLSGRSHRVVTAVTLLGATRSGQVDETCVETTTVEFAPISEREIAWYVASGEPMDKAGGYAVQGLASRFVTRVEGSYSNVVGLPVSLVYVMCKRVGLLLS